MPVGLIEIICDSCQSGKILLCVTGSSMNSGNVCTNSDDANCATAELKQSLQVFIGMKLSSSV